MHGVARTANPSRNTRNIDDHSATLLQHMRDDGLAAIERPSDI